MRAVDYLQGYQRALREWRRLCEEADRMRALGTRVSRAFDGIPAGPDGRSKVEAAIEGVSEVLAKADAAKLNVAARRAEVEGIINALPDDRCRAVLRLRYLNGYNWQTVADKAGYSESNVYRLRRRALSMVQAVLDEK